jgi:Fur family ferric uptake transcriptional regulator
LWTSVRALRISRAKEEDGWAVGVRAQDATKTARRRTGTAIERACRAHGLRMTGQRRVIARILGEAEDHPDVVELHRRAATVDDRISLSTVYRTVKLFETEGIIERLELRDGRARYERAPRQHHDHLINLETGAVVEFRSEAIEALQAEIAKGLGFRLVYHRLELYAVPLDEDGAGSA